MSYIHLATARGSWLIGYFTINPDGDRVFHELRECETDVEAAAFINYLNGGAGKAFEWDDDE